MPEAVGRYQKTNELYLAQLRRLLVQHFDIGELKTLSFDIGIDFDELSGDTKSAKARELVGYLVRQDRLQELLIVATEQRPTVAWPGAILTSEGCPYRGLSAFQEEDEPFFFGRKAFTERLIPTIHSQGLVAVIGPSGSGKSSVVFAGLLPQLRREGWLIASFRPGERPFYSLAAALVLLLEPTLSEVDVLLEASKLATGLGAGTVALDNVLGRILRKQLNIVPFLLVVDQFEELYTLCREPEIREQFLNALLGLTPNQPKYGRNSSTVKVVLTLRADFFGQALAYRPFSDSIQDRAVMVGPMTREELQEAIVLPALKSGVAFEPGLVERILDEAGPESNFRAEVGLLPLLEFALTQLWVWQANGRLTHLAYETIGQVTGALANHADAVYDDLNSLEQEQVQRVLVQMVQPGIGTEDTRRQASRGELKNADWELVQELADARLVVTDQDESGLETAELVHEALIQRWDRLRDWIQADRSFRVWQERLRAAYKQWETSSRDDGALLRGVPLAEAEGWLVQRQESLSETEKAFISVSLELQNREKIEKEHQQQRELEGALRLAEAERKRAEERSLSLQALRRRSYYLLTALVATLLAAIAAFYFALASQRNETVAQSALATVQASGNMDTALSANATEQAIGIAIQWPQSELGSGNQLLTGGIRIAFAEFTVIGSLNPSLGRNFSVTLQERFLGEVETHEQLWDFPIQVIGPEEVGQISGSSILEIDQGAFELAARIRADVLVYGVILVDDAAIRILPRYSISGGLFELEYLELASANISSELVLNTEEELAQIEYMTSLSSRFIGLLLTLIGGVYNSVGDYEEALQVLETANQLQGWKSSEGQEISYALTGNALLAQGKTTEAIASCEQALIINPTYFPALFCLGNLHYANGDFEAAHSYFEASLKLNNLSGASRAVALAQAGSTRRALGLEREAMNLCEQSQALLPNFYALMCLAEGYYQQENRDQAISSYENAYELSTNPSRKATAALKLAEIYQQVGSLELAISWYETALAFAPEGTDMRAEIIRRLDGLK